MRVRDSLAARRDPRPATKRAEAVVFQAAALVLGYPEAALPERLDTIEAALAEAGAAEGFTAVLAHLRSAPLRELQSYHVQEFDLSRKHALHLSYWTDGDTRRRGEVLADIKRVYRESGLVVDTRGELPDYLPMVLEFAAVDPARGTGLLQRFRASLELIRLGLEADRLPHAGVLAAICGLLPGESPRTRAEVQARFGEVQPVEFVGLSGPSPAEFVGSSGPSPVEFNGSSGPSPVEFNGSSGPSPVEFNGSSGPSPVELVETPVRARRS